MTDEQIETLKTETEGLLKIFDESECVKEARIFDLPKIKECVFAMIDFAVKNETERDSLKTFLSETDFFKSPASTKFHGNWESGLCVHTLLVAVQALRFAVPVAQNFSLSPVSKTLAAENLSFTAEDIFLSAICHDFCKVDCYKTEYHNTKDVMGNWTKKPVYKVKPNLRNLGHGNESVLQMIKIMPSLINRRNVIEAVSRHMGFSDLSDMEAMNYSNFLDNPLVLLLQLADQSAAAWWDC